MVSNLHPYHHVVTEGHETLSVFPTDGGGPIVVTDDHPYFAAILAGASEDGPAADLRTLADLTAAVANKFENLSERVSVANGRIYFDGDEVESGLTAHMRRCLDDSNVGDWRPLVAFMENIANNPNEHSREELYGWLNSRDFTINADGRFVGYKGVESNGEGGYRSLSSGTAAVNGEVHSGKIPNAVGDIVTMPRSDVLFEPGSACNVGLHVGTYSFAQGYARSGVMLKVLVNPRDVVSVPNGTAEKMRVCRYEVAEIIEEEIASPVDYSGEEEDDWYEGYDCECEDCLEERGELDEF